MDHSQLTTPVNLGLVLVGYRATGKTTVGRLIADRLGRTFVDSDQEIEQRTGWSIAEHFAQAGELGFRNLESKMIRTLCEQFPGSVLATGGGTILRETNREILRRFGLVIWLSAPTETIVARLERDPGARPSLTSAGLLDEVASVLIAREALYRDVAHFVVDASADDPRVVAETVIRRLLEECGPI